MIDRTIHFDIDTFKSGWRALSILCESPEEMEALLHHIHSMDATITHSAEVERARRAITDYNFWFWCTRDKGREGSKESSDGYYIDCCEEDAAVSGSNDYQFSNIIWDDGSAMSISKENLLEFL